MRLAAVLVLALLCSGCRAPSPTHIVLFYVDSLRSDHVGAYGYERNTSPRIDALAREGTLFERALSSSNWTLPATAALLTGLSDSLHGVQNANRALARGIPTLAATLSHAGFATGAVVGSPLLHPRFGLGRGFDDYWSCMSYLDDEFAEFPGTSPELHRESHRDVTGPCVVRRTREWLEQHREGPAFLFVHFWDVHYDYNPPESWATRFDPDYEGSLDASNFARNPDLHAGMDPRDLEHLVALYDGEIAYTDSQVGAVLDLLDELAIASTTLVVFTADHGEAFFEHGAKGHRNELHAEEVRIPLILRGPGVPVGERRPGPAHLTDVAPTVLDFTLGQSLTPAPGRGRSLRTALTDPDALADRWVLSELAVGSRRRAALESLNEKVMADRETHERLAFDLDRDPGEANPSAPSRAAADRFAREREALDAARRGMPKPVPLRQTPSGLEARLRSLGYVE
jgi:arylsulfatase